MPVRKGGRGAKAANRRRALAKNRRTNQQSKNGANSQGNDQKELESLKQKKAALLLKKEELMKNKSPEKSVSEQASFFSGDSNPGNMTDLLSKSKNLPFQNFPADHPVHEQVSQLTDLLAREPKTMAPLLSGLLNTVKDKELQQDLLSSLKDGKGLGTGLQGYIAQQVQKKTQEMMDQKENAAATSSS